MSVNEELQRLADDYASTKISRRRLWQGTAGLGLSAAWIAALEKGATAAPAPTWQPAYGLSQTDKATTLILAVAETVDTFDPGFTVGSKTAQTTIQNTFDQLTQYEIVAKQTPDGTAYKTVNTANILPMLCQSWKMDGADMVFTMRDGATYSNGDPIDATTMVSGYKRIYETKAVSSFLLSMGGGIVDSSAFSAPDPKTFVMKMSKPNTLIPKNNVMHNTSALDPKDISAHKTASDPWAKDYFQKNLGIGNGPYKLDSYKPDDSIVLVANDKYYGDKPAFTKVILKFVSDATQRVQLLQKGDVDYATKIPIKELDGLKTNPNIKVLSIPTDLIEFLEMNTTVPPFDKKEVRQAVAYATPYQAIIDQVYKGQAQVAKSLVPNGMPTSDFSSNKYQTNLDKANQLLAAGGYPGGQGLPDIKLTFRNDDVQWERISILMQDALKKIGMNVTLEKLPYAEFNKREQASQLQMWTDEWISWVKDPYYHMSWLAASTSPTNYPKFKIDRVDQIISQYALSVDSPEKEAASKEAQALIIEECPYVFICQPNWVVYTRKDIDGYIYYNDELPRYYHLVRTK